MHETVAAVAGHHVAFAHQDALVPAETAFGVEGEAGVECDAGHFGRAGDGEVDVPARGCQIGIVDRERRVAAVAGLEERQCHDARVGPADIALAHDPRLDAVVGGRGDERDPRAVGAAA